MNDFLYIAIVGSIQNLTDAEFNKHIEHIVQVCKENEPNKQVCLINGFMDKQSILDKDWDTHKRDILNYVFSCQINFWYRGGIHRDFLTSLASYIPIKCFVVAEPNENVQKEIDAIYNSGQQHSLIVNLY